MILTTGQILRGGNPVPGLTDMQQVQIDEMQADPRQFDRGAAPFDAYTIFIPYASEQILRNDQFEDTGVLNTGLYRFFSKPESFPDGHYEIQAFQSIGT